MDIVLKLPQASLEPDELMLEYVLEQWTTWFVFVVRVSVRLVNENM